MPQAKPFVPDLDDEAVQEDHQAMVDAGIAIWDPTTASGIRVLKPLGEGWRKEFLNAIRQFGTMREACRVVRKSRIYISRKLKEDPRFKEYYEAAKQDYMDMVERVAFKKAEQGSEIMLKFVLSGHRSDTYNPTRKLEAQITQTTDLTTRGDVNYSNEQLADLLNILSVSGALNRPGEPEEATDTETN